MDVWECVCVCVCVAHMRTWRWHKQVAMHVRGLQACIVFNFAPFTEHPLPNFLPLLTKRNAHFIILLEDPNFFHRVPPVDCHLSHALTMSPLKTHLEPIVTHPSNSTSQTLMAQHMAQHSKRPWRYRPAAPRRPAPCHNFYIRSGLLLELQPSEWKQLETDYLPDCIKV